MAERNTDRIRYRYGICLNDNCEKCKSKEVQEIPARKDFVCQNPECGKPLRECPPPKKGSNKKTFGIIASVIAIIALAIGFTYLALSGEKEHPEEVEGGGTQPEPSVTIVLNKSNLLLKEGESESLTYTISPDGNTDEVEWQSGSPDVATVNNGIVTAMKEGVSTIIATVKGHEDAMAIANVIVTPQDQGESEKGEDSPKTEGPKSIDLGYATYTGGTANGKPDGNGIMEFKRDYTLKLGSNEYEIKAGERITGMFRNGQINLATWYQRNGNETIIKP